MENYDNVEGDGEGDGDVRGDVEGDIVGVGDSDVRGDVEDDGDVHGPSGQRAFWWVCQTTLSLEGRFMITCTVVTVVTVETVCNGCQGTEKFDLLYILITVEHCNNECQKSDFHWCQHGKYNKNDMTID